MPHPLHASRHDRRQRRAGRHRRTWTLVPVIAALALVLPAMAQAPAPETRLRAVEGALDDSKRAASDLADRRRSLDDDLARIRARLIEAAKAAQAHEATLSATETRLAELEASAADARSSLHALRRRLTLLSGAAQRFAYRPPEAFLASRRPPVETARAALLMRFALGTLSEVVRETDANLADLARIEAEIAAERDSALAATRRLAHERETLAALMAEKAAVRERTDAQRADVERRIRDLARSADSLRGLVERLQRRGDDRLAEADRLAQTIRPSAPSRETMIDPNAAEAPGATDDGTPDRPFVAQLPAGPPIESRKGRLAQPVAGRIVERFGRRGSTGVTAKGLTFETREGAQVVATYDGKVIYAGPFRGYGEIIIIDHGDGYHSLVAGLGRIDLDVGQGVLAGEPIGVMPESRETASPLVTGTAGGPKLYMELRHDGDPIDPLAWLAPRNVEVRG